MSRAALVVYALCLSTALGYAQVQVPELMPGTELTFGPHPRNAEWIACRIGNIPTQPWVPVPMIDPNLFVECNLPRFGATQTALLPTEKPNIPGDPNFIFGRETVSAGVALPSGLGIPNYATALIWNEFKISHHTTDPNDHVHLVDAQISVTFDYVFDMLAGGAFETRALVTMTVSDITGRPVQIATHTLATLERDNTQGFTDVSGQRVRQSWLDENEAFQVKLQRGKTYAIIFQAQVLSEAFIFAAMETTVRATRKDLRILLGEDEVELIENLDMKIDQLISRPLRTSRTRNR